MNSESLSKASSPARRGYNRSLRDKQAGETHETILTAMAELIRSGEIEDFTYPQLAARSGISVPTLYRHFPSRKNLFDALFAWLDVKLKAPAFPRNLKEMVEKTPELFDYYHRQRDLLCTARVGEFLREVGEEAQRKRDIAFVRILEPLTRHLPLEKANAFHGMARLFYSFDSYLMMHKRFNVGPKEASDTAVWMLKSLLERLEAEKPKASTPANKAVKVRKPVPSIKRKKKS